MITGDEVGRRLLLLLEAMWEARVSLAERAERELNRENLDWFERERFDGLMEGHRRVLRALEEVRLQAAYDSEPVGVKCTPRERSEALRLAFDVLEGKLAPGRGIELFLTEGFPREEP